MIRRAAKFDERNVFINCPFDGPYERLFLALIAALVCLSRAPRCVLEIPENGNGRLARLLELIAECHFSIHDLSRVGTPVRFNMPFELGLAFAIAQARSPKGGFILLESQPFRIDRTLSDMKGRDPVIHSGSYIQLVNGILGELRVKDRRIDPVTVQKLTKRPIDVVLERKRKIRARTIYSGAMFDFSVAAATELAVDARLLTK